MQFFFTFTIHHTIPFLKIQLLFFVLQLVIFILKKCVYNPLEGQPIKTTRNDKAVALAFNT